MKGFELAPLHFHRRRRDHWLRMLLMQGQKLFPALKRNSRISQTRFQELFQLHKDARFHAREVLRPRELEWPGSQALPVDAEIVQFLDELEHWLLLLEELVKSKDGFQSEVVALLEKRIQSRLHLTHRMPVRPAMY
jgi:hypothetical protein